MDENTKNFLDFWEQFEWPTEPVLHYRLYYDDDGVPITYSRNEMPGKYIDVSVDDFVRADHRVRVCDGKIVYPSTQLISKLKPNSVGTPCHPHDITIIVSPEQPHLNWKLCKKST